MRVRVRVRARARARARASVRARVRRLGLSMITTRKWCLQGGLGVRATYTKGEWDRERPVM